MSAALSCSLGSLPVSTGSLRMFLRGNWIAETSFGATAGPAVGEAATLLVAREDGVLDVFVGTVRRSGFVAADQTATVTLVGGAGKLLDIIGPREHVSGSTPIPAGLIARGICDDAGEVLAAGVETALDALLVPRWHRMQSEAGTALDVLVSLLGLSWRALADGSIWVGAETWPEAPAEFHAMARPADGLDEYATDGAPLRPGMTVGGERAVELLYSFGSGALRCEVRRELAGDVAHEVDLARYGNSYPAVVRTNDVFGGHAIAVTCDDPEVGDLLDVPFRCGVPGALVAIPTDARVRICFEGGDPRGAYATALDQLPGSATAYRVARISADEVDCGWIGIAVDGSAPAGYGLVTVAANTPGAIHVIGSITGPGSAYVKLA